MVADRLDETSDVHRRSWINLQNLVVVERYHKSNGGSLKNLRWKNDLKKKKHSA